MAHSPEKKARAVADFLAGEGWDEVSDRHQISKSTLKRWIAEANVALIQPPSSDPRIEQKSNSNQVQETNSLDLSTARIEQVSARFQIALIELLLASVEMGTSIARTCSDPTFIKDKPGGVNELVRTVLERADSLVAYLKIGNAGDQSGSDSK